jgi:hypothetical protein
VSLVYAQVERRRSTTYDGDDELADTHAGSADDEETTTADLVDKGQRADGRNGVDDITNDGNDEGVRHARRLEERRAVVEDEVDTGELLPLKKRHVVSDNFQRARRRKKHTACKKIPVQVRSP